MAKALIRPLTWESPYAMGVAQKRKKEIIHETQTGLNYGIQTIILKLKAPTQLTVLAETQKSKHCSITFLCARNNSGLLENPFCANQNHHPTLVRMAIIKKSLNNKCWMGCGEKGTPPHCWWEHRLVQPLRRTVRRFRKKTKNRVAI